MKTGIPWWWLKQTPVGSSGLIPQIGMRYEHRERTVMCCEHIIVRNGSTDFRVIRDDSKKSGWSAPHVINH